MLAVPSIMGRKPSGRLSLPITIPAYAAATIYCKPKKADIGKVEWTERVRLWQVDNNSCSVRWDSCRIIPEYYFSLINCCNCCKCCKCCNCCNCCKCCKLFSEGLFQPLTPTSPTALQSNIFTALSQPPYNSSYAGMSSRKTYPFVS